MAMDMVWCCLVCSVVALEVGFGGGKAKGAQTQIYNSGFGTTQNFDLRLRNESPSSSIRSEDFVHMHTYSFVI